jgi:hypothetical protein
VQGESFRADPDPPVGVVFDQVVPATEGPGIGLVGSPAAVWVLVVEGVAVVDVAAPDGLSAGWELAGVQ